MACLYSLLQILFFMTVMHEIADGADKAYLKETIRNYFSDTRHAIANPSYKQRARNFIFEEFKSFGLETEYHEFKSSNDGSEQRYWNVIGVLKGDAVGKADDNIIGLGAHYDTVAMTKGVDDNGSGMAAILETAKQITQQNKDGVKRKNTILFVAFDLEEKYLTGSGMLITQWINPWLSKTYGAMSQYIKPTGVIVLDTVMAYNNSAQSQTVPGDATQFQSFFPESFQSIQSDNFEGDFVATIYRKGAQAGDDKLALTFKDQWNKHDTADYEVELFGLPSFWLQNKEAFSDFLRSDHYNFWIGNVPAIFLTDSANLRGDMKQCYHHSCDNIDVMLTDENIGFLGKTVDTLVATIDKLSESSSQTSDAVTGRDCAAFTTFLALLAFSLI